MAVVEEETLRALEEEDDAMTNEPDGEPMDGLDGDEEEADSPATMKVGEEKEIGKQGLRKKLVKEGEGWERPETGDEVEGMDHDRPLCIYLITLRNTKPNG